MRTTYVYGAAFWDFYYAQRPEVQDKIDWVIGLVRTLRMVPEKFFKHLEGTEGLFEIEKAERLKKKYYEEKSRK
jgi:hypothetical protein